MPLSDIIPSAIGSAMTSGGTANMPDPNTGNVRDQVRMSPLMFRSTFDEDFKKENPATAAMNAYRHKFQPELQTPYHLGEQYGRPLLNGGVNMLSKWFNQGPGMAGGMGALGGGLLGYLGASGLNMVRGDDAVNPTYAALLGALGGGLFGGAGGWVKNRADTGTLSPYAPTPSHIGSQDYNDYFQSMGVPVKSGSENKLPTLKLKFKKSAKLEGKPKAITSKQAVSKYTRSVKSASWRDGSSDSFRSTLDEADHILAVIRRSAGLSSMEKAQMMEGVSQLSMADVLNLKQLIGLSSGAAAGAIIARFLLNRGLIGTLVGALAGGAVGGSLFGQRSSGSSTFLGQPLSF
jgi:hypothetical protein